jgi:Phosphotransferase enzyme family
MPPTAADADARLALAEYDVGELISVEPLAAGSASARKVTTTRGSYLLKPAYRTPDVDLQAQLAPALTARGIRQPLVMHTSAGELVTRTGFVLLEFLPGAVAWEPTPDQVTAAMRHIGAFHAEIGRLAPDYRPDPDSVWSQCADPSFLLAELPGLLARADLRDGDTDAALDLLQRSAAELAALPRQVVHGDIGPDNVLMDGTEVIALIDFTPHWEPVLFAACSALYWYHVYGSDTVSVHTAPASTATASTATASTAPASTAPARTPLRDRLRTSLAAIGEGRPWRADEIAVWPAGLIREALRRLAVPLVLADRGDTTGVARTSPRLEAVRAVVRVLPKLSGSY